MGEPHILGSSLKVIKDILERVTRKLRASKTGGSLSIELLKVEKCSGGHVLEVINVTGWSIGRLVDLISDIIGYLSKPLIVVPGRTLGALLRDRILHAIIIGYNEVQNFTGEDERIVLVLPEVWARIAYKNKVKGEGLELLEILESIEGIDVCKDDIVVVTRALDSSRGGNVIGGSSRISEHLIGYMESEALELFKQFYGELKPSRGQLAAWKVLLMMLELGGSLIVVMPTGSGKSAIFHVASRLAALNDLGSYTLVITPLRALMRDQVRRANSRGLRTAYIDSTIPRAERNKIYNSIRRGLLDILYVSPERFWDVEFRRFLEGERPSLIVLDEVHVVTSWGSTFRPSYLNVARTLASYRSEFKPPILGLSATLTLENARAVLEMLGHRGKPKIVDLNSGGDIGLEVDPRVPVIVKTSPIRENLRFDIEIAPSGYERLGYVVKLVKEKVEELRSHGTPWVGVVFTGYAESKAAGWANVDVIVRALREFLDVEVIGYHGELGDRVRGDIEGLLLSRSLKEVIVVATKAFGMGVDLPNIRWIIFYTPSDSIEELYQESGRAGRDGAPAFITILYNSEDIELKRGLVRMSRLRPSYVLRVYNTLAKIVESLPVNYQYVIVPLDTFKYKAYALRALEMLGDEGLLDYHVIRGSSLTLSSKGEGVYMKLDNSTYITPYGDGAKVEVRVCRSNPLYDPIKLEVYGKVLLAPGRCPGHWVKVGGSSGILAIEVTRGSLDYRDSLDPQTMYNYVKSWVKTESSLDDVASLVERALAHKMRGGAVDSVVKKGIIEYLEGRVDGEGRPPEMPRIVRCRGGECYDRVVEELRRLLKALGGLQGITIFYENPWDPGMLIQAYKKVIGWSRPVKMKRLEKIFQIIARGGWERLLDEGYIVILSKPGERLERLIESLEGYKFHVTMVYDNPV